MADDEESDQAEWLVAPPGAGEVRLVLELGDGVELDAEQTEALGNLIEALEGAEVEGFAFGGAPTLKVGLMSGMGPSTFGVSTCGGLICKGHNCDSLACTTYSSSLTGFGRA